MDTTQQSNEAGAGVPQTPFEKWEAAFRATHGRTPSAFEAYIGGVNANPPTMVANPAPMGSTAHLPRPALESVWQHRKGPEYTVLLVTSEPDPERADKFPVTVIYRAADGRIWPRLLPSFLESFDLAHNAPPQKTKESDADVQNARRTVEHIGEDELVAMVRMLGYTVVPAWSPGKSDVLRGCIDASLDRAATALRNAGGIEEANDATRLEYLRCNLILPDEEPAATGWLVRGESTHLYVDSASKPNFALINGHDKVVSIEPRYATPPARPAWAPSLTNDWSAAAYRQAVKAFDAREGRRPEVREIGAFCDGFGAAIAAARALLFAGPNCNEASRADMREAFSDLGYKDDVWPVWRDACHWQVTDSARKERDFLSAPERSAIEEAILCLVQSELQSDADALSNLLTRTQQ